MCAKRPGFFRRRQARSAVLSTLLVLFAFAPLPARSQGIEQSAGYISQIDNELTIRKVGVLPVSDNLDGIYARPVETQLIQLVKGNHHWDFTDIQISGNIPVASDLEASPAEVTRIGREAGADALLVARASKGPNGISLLLNLFLVSDGKILAQSILKDHPRFEVRELQERITGLYKEVVSKIPYEGLVLSRQLNRVTLNLGKADGVANGQVVTAVQIIKTNRHPKFNFIISTDKEILGKIKILKVENTLSFGTIVSEKERGAIQKFSKISGLDFVSYPVPEELGEGASQAGGALGERTDSKVSFGKNPVEWLPQKPPTFGQVGFKMGLGSYTGTLNLNGMSTLEASSRVFPSIGLYGELWINPRLLVRADLQQGIISTDNPRPGSSPSELSHSISRYSLALGYNFLMHEDFFGPKVQVLAGFMNYRNGVDDSQPQSLTTVQYSGFLLGLTGSLPVTEDKVWSVGAKLNLVLAPKFREQPVTSGSSSRNTINDFSVFAERKLGENLRAVGSLDFMLYTSHLSGVGTRSTDGVSETASSISQRYTILSGGIAYLF